ncbi:MAG: 4Fe-4S binding protein [Verrucomicrobiales bacterium]|nr:4Fe-4S binding protein [Verrucomicrobiae bacterium]
MDRIAPLVLQIYRFAVLAGVGALLQAHFAEMREQGERPVTVSEVRAFLPQAHRLVVSSEPGGGLEVRDAAGSRAGHAWRTMPQSRGISGYSGPLDALVVAGGDGRIVGVAVRHSYDTPSHVEDVGADLYFMEGWNGKSPEEAVAMALELEQGGVHIVSGATRTSECLVRSVAERLRPPGAPDSQPIWSPTWRDGVLGGLLIGALLATFGRGRWLGPWRRVFPWLAFAGLGLLTGDLLAQSLYLGWLRGGVPWHQTPGVALLAAAAFLVPGTTKKPVYCSWLCPHGHLQRWLVRWMPARWRVALPASLRWALGWFPVMILAVLLVAAFLGLPLDPAGVEPFDAYVWRSAGVATLVVAGAGLLVSAFVPMAYCHFGCPTGWLLGLIRRRETGGQSRWDGRDTAALLLLLLALGLDAGRPGIQAWLGL